ncbi:hypothetical protein ACPOL_4390 [Acidisarcina polymorpha]|uniref:DUF5668 domain-containing protein n=1 Tax=Acidisarcina polymorpha TaxID=2211140 RepID=A0A2Z5G371_9BACT|nr:hypothetical protein [Acidisarcina polymorpha]AXC13663.1 hypothetical protein ACPOL_4390 [Acidisarcina polymorpha]
MTQWLLIRRLRGPAFLLLLGIMAMLHEWTDFGFSRSWPLFLILGGVLALAERAALAQADLEAYDPTTGQPRSMAGSTHIDTGNPIGSPVSPAGPGPDPTAGRP